MFGEGDSRRAVVVVLAVALLLAVAAFSGKIRFAAVGEGVIFIIDSINSAGYRVTSYSIYGETHGQVGSAGVTLTPLANFLDGVPPPVPVEWWGRSKVTRNDFRYATEARIEVKSDINQPKKAFILSMLWEGGNNYKWCVGGDTSELVYFESYGMPWCKVINVWSGNAIVALKSTGDRFVILAKYTPYGWAEYSVVFSDAFARLPRCGNNVCDTGETAESCLSDCAVPVIAELKATRLKLRPNELLAMESFAGGATISKLSTRYPVVSFASIIPAIVIDATDNSVSTTTEIYVRLDRGEVIQVPQQQTYSLFYVIINNYQLPTICDAIDVSTGLCASIQPGIVVVCSEGQFNPSLGLCVVQPSSKIICEVGRYDTALDACLWNPPLQAVCSLGTYDPNTHQCYYYPPPTLVCESGFTYDPTTGKCVKYPDKMINCPAGYAYELPPTDKCVKYPISITICTQGSTFNTTSQKCEYRPGEAYVCILGFSYNPATKKCEKLVTDILTICGNPDATYDPTTGKCVLTPPEHVACERGILNPEKTMCIYSPSVHATCVQGTYNATKDACVYEPDLDYLCAVGELTWVGETAMCAITPTPIIICRAGYAYDKEIDKCVRKPLDIVCNYDTVCEEGEDKTCLDCTTEKEWTDYIVPGLGVSGIALVVWTYLKHKKN